jgi:aryl-alcohol dehydrogenase-like predicted oxidoreductase
MQERIAKHRPQLERWERLCAELGQRPPDVALAWLMQRPGVTAPIVGPRTSEQLEDALRASELKLEPKAVEAIEQIWPGPGGEAPEAYAW